MFPFYAFVVSWMEKRNLNKLKRNRTGLKLEKKGLIEKRYLLENTDRKVLPIRKY